MNGGDIEQKEQMLEAPQTSQMMQRERAVELGRSVDIALQELESEQQLGQERGVDRERAGNLGGKVLTYNPENTAMETSAERSVAESNQAVREMAAIENYGEQVLSNPNLAGTESELQIKERIAADQEDIANENGFSPYAQRIMERNNERLTKETVMGVDRMIAENNFHPAQLDKKTNEARAEFLLKVFNRVFGIRN